MRISKAAVSACIAAILSNACGTVPQEHFYTLQSAALPATASTVGNTRYSVSVGPVTVPEIVDRPQFVIRQSPNRVEVIEQHRWAQSLRTEIARVLADDLAGRLVNSQVTPYTDYASQNAGYRILIDVERFDAVPGEAVTVQAVWTVRRTAAEVSTTGRSMAREPVHAGGYEELAAAYGRALSAISADIGNAVQSLQAASER
jgi:uncharacterized lipoprotein YmbA